MKPTKAKKPGRKRETTYKNKKPSFLYKPIKDSLSQQKTTQSILQRIIFSDTLDLINLPSANE